MSPTTFCGVGVHMRTQMRCQPEPVVFEAPLVTTMACLPTPAIDWEARCRAAEALLEVALDKCATFVAFPPPMRGMHQCDNFAVGVDCTGKLACEWHNHDELEESEGEVAEYVGLLKIWLALRGPK